MANPVGFAECQSLALLPGETEMLYLYRIAAFKGDRTSLNRGDDKPIVYLAKGMYGANARAACETHYAKACAAARNFGRDKPTARYL